MDSDKIPSINRQLKTTRYLLDKAIDGMTEVKVWIEWEKGVEYSTPYTAPLKDIKAYHEILAEALSQLQEGWNLIKAAEKLTNALTLPTVRAEITRRTDELKRCFWFCLVETKNLIVTHSGIHDKVDSLIKEYAEACYLQVIEETS